MKNKVQEGGFFERKRERRKNSVILILSKNSTHFETFGCVFPFLVDITEILFYYLCNNAV